MVLLTIMLPSIPCSSKTERCINCSNHFYELRHQLTEVYISKPFKREVPHYEQIIADILSCVQINFHELHKFEEKIEDLFIFRAKKEDIHFIYVIDQRKRLILLRAFHNFKEYKKYLEKKKEIVKLVRRCE